ncbi:hypothetical protein EDD15DRAFT_2244772 [Pisolithus albus]|nr:hypothetical protein EDD15DRAFT_2244772 [Pisolithus albus]
MVLPLGEAGAQQRDPARGGYSLKIEGDVLESQVFRKEVGEEREDADPQSSSREGNESNLKVQTGDTVTEREDTDLQSHPFDSERKGSEPNVCVIHDTTDLPPVEPHVSVSDSSVRELGDNPSLVPPGTKLRPRRSGITPKSSRFFQVLKSPRGTQEKERASPVIVQAAKFNNVGTSHYAIPGYGDNR